MVFGTNGVGKTTLVKNILKSDSDMSEPDEDCLLDCFDFYEYNCDYGKYTISKGGDYVAVGSYANNCGGADGIRDSFSYYSILNFLMDKYPTKNLCVEGVMQHSTDKLIELFNEAESKGYDVILVHLKSTLDKAVERVSGRSGKNPNVDIMKSKLESIDNQIKRFDKFNVVTIDTTDKTVEEVFSSFIKKHFTKKHFTKNNKVLYL